MNDLRLYVLFNSISVISVQWADDNERLCEMEPRLRLRRFRLEGEGGGGLDFDTARLVVQCLATELTEPRGFSFLPFM